MNFIKLGQSDIETAPIILGTWALGGWLWGGTEKNKPLETIQASIEAGVNCIDTAPVYGFGLSEELVGDAIKGRRDKVIVATKCGLVWDGRKGTTKFFDSKDNEGKDVEVHRCLRKESILAECDVSLQKLGIDVIDLYQCHWPDPGTPIDETIEALVELKEKGKIREFGVSNFTAEMVDEMIQKGAVPVSNQIKYSFLSKETEEDIIPFCRDNNIGIIAYSPMEMGLLAGKITMETEFSENDTRGIRPWFEKENRKKALDAIDTLRPIAEKYDITIAQLVLAATIEVPGVTTVIAGARTPEQSISNAGALDFEFAPEDLEFILDTFKPLKLDKPFDPGSQKR